jgi:hypothetical protein
MMGAMAATTRPKSVTKNLNAAEGIVYDWLAANGVDEWIPERPTFTVDAGTLTYSAWRWQVDRGGRSLRGWDVGNVELAGAYDIAREDRTVPLVSPLTERVRKAMSAGGVVLVERAERRGLMRRPGGLR